MLNVETSGEHRLDEDDFGIIQIVGDRVASRSRWDESARS